MIVAGKQTCGLQILARTVLQHPQPRSTLFVATCAVGVLFRKPVLGACSPGVTGCFLTLLYVCAGYMTRPANAEAVHLAIPSIGHWKLSTLHSLQLMVPHLAGAKAPMSSQQNWAGRRYLFPADHTLSYAGTETYAQTHTSIVYKFMLWNLSFHCCMQRF